MADIVTTKWTDYTRSNWALFRDESLMNLCSGAMRVSTALVLGVARRTCLNRAEARVKNASGASDTDSRVEGRGFQLLLKGRSGANEPRIDVSRILSSRDITGGSYCEERWRAYRVCSTLHAARSEHQQTERLVYRAVMVTPLSSSSKSVSIEHPLISPQTSSAHDRLF